MIALVADACLRAIPGWEGCDACAQACSVSALAFRGRDLRFAAACLGCGRCAAACPNEAIAVAAFAPGPLPRGETVTVTCGRDPEAKGAHAIPCLAGLSAIGWLELVDRADRRLMVIDRGWCAACPAGTGAARPWSAALAGAIQQLGSARWSSSLMPVVVERPLSPRLARALPVIGRQLARRAMLSRLAGPGPDLDTARRVLRVRAEAPRRRLEALARLAARSAAPPPPVFPSVAAEGCAGHGVCAAVCPTGALARSEGAGRGILTFDAAQCLGCRRCAETCPEAAITVGISGGISGGDASRARRTLAAQALSDCTRCGTTFTDGEGDDLCPRCRSAFALARSPFASGQIRGPGTMTVRREDA